MIGLAPKAGLAYLASLRIHSTQTIPDRGIFALWHADLPVCMKAFSRRGILVLLSSSRDGEIAARINSRLGYRIVRGSSSRGGAAALKAIFRAMRMEGGPQALGMALDGPKGPREIAKPGTLWLAKTLDLPIWPVGVHYRGAWRLKSWDGARLPYPFLGQSRVAIGPALSPQCDISALAQAMQNARESAEGNSVILG